MPRSRVEESVVLRCIKDFPRQKVLAISNAQGHPKATPTRLLLTGKSSKHVRASLTTFKANVRGVYKTPKGFSILLEPKGAERVLPVFVSKGQARSIQLGISGKNPPRPLTHDLLLNIVEDLDLEVRSVTIDDLIGKTFVAELRLLRDDRDFPYDVRPSDGIALAVRRNADIFVSSDVMERAGRREEDMPDYEPGR